MSWEDKHLSLRMMYSLGEKSADEISALYSLHSSSKTLSDDMFVATCILNVYKKKRI